MLTFSSLSLKVYWFSKGFTVILIYCTDQTTDEANQSQNKNGKKLCFFHIVRREESRLNILQYKYTKASYYSGNRAVFLGENWFLNVPLDLGWKPGLKRQTILIPKLFQRFLFYLFLTNLQYCSTTTYDCCFALCI